MATITGTAGNDQLSGQAGDEIVTGGGQDTVVSHFQSITIDDFAPGPGGDVLDVDNGSYIGHVNMPSFASGNAWLSQEGADAVLNINPVFSVTGMTAPVQIVFKGVDANSLTADNFASFNPVAGQYVHTDNPQAGSYRGTAANDVLAAQPGANHLMGAGGDDTTFGNAGADTHSGGAGNDVLVDTSGVDVLNGGDGNDTLWGGDDTDFLYGGNGDDVLVGQGGVNLLTGGAGADLFFVTNDTSAWIVDFNKAEGDHVALPHGVTYTMGQFDGFVAVELSTGQQIGIQGATVAGLGSDWAVYT
jgi:Ca2+-binding RTX toxin-like protein